MAGKIKIKPSKVEMSNGEVLEFDKLPENEKKELVEELTKRAYHAIGYRENTA